MAADSARAERFLSLPRERRLPLDRPLVMAILNLNDDSFYAESRCSGDSAVEVAIERALAAEAAGADIIDLGGESTRPGACYVDAETELARVVPVVESLRRHSDISISIDTRKAAVAEAALRSGADIVNDVSALEDDPGLAPICARYGAAVVLMHKRGTPATMQDNPEYRDPVAEIGDYLTAAADRAMACGIERGKIVVDPGIGFGKRPEDNLALIARLAEIGRRGYPVLVGLSRKSFLAPVTGREVGDRLAGTLAANYAALEGGAAILRVHDVAETVDLVKVFWALRKASAEEGVRAWNG